MTNRKLTTFYIIRHGQTEFNVKGIVQGHSDSPLTAEGLIQIKELAKKFKDKDFDLAFSSDLLRARRTAEIIALEHELEVKVTSLLRERNFGEFEAKESRALEAYYNLLDKLDKNERFKYSDHGVESDESVATRLMTFIRETAITHPDKNILVATHGSVLRVLLIHLGYGTYQNMRSGGIDNLAWIKIETDGSDVFIRHTEGVHLHA